MMRTLSVAFAVLVAATLMLLPYTFDYELAILAIPLAILADDVLRRGGTIYEKVGLIVAFQVPTMMLAVATAVYVQIGFPMLMGVLFLATHRALSAAAQERAAEDGRLAPALYPAE